MHYSFIYIYIVCKPLNCTSYSLFCLCSYFLAYHIAEVLVVSWFEATCRHDMRIILWGFIYHIIYYLEIWSRTCSFPLCTTLRYRSCIQIFIMGGGLPYLADFQRITSYPLLPVALKESSVIRQAVYGRYRSFLHPLLQLIIPPFKRFISSLDACPYYLEIKIFIRRVSFKVLALVVLPASTSHLTWRLMKVPDYVGNIFSCACKWKSDTVITPSPSLSVIEH